MIILSLFIGLVCSDVQIPGPLPRSFDTPQGERLSPQRTAPEYSFSRAPYSLMTSYYDYMIGSYNGLPLRLVPESAGGGYFLTYHGMRTATSLRRVFYAHISPAGNVINNSEINLENIREGYPTLAVDPVSGKPLYAWHSNFQSSDAELEVRFIADAFIDGIYGLWDDPQTIVDNPWILQTTTDNEFIWPTATIGPSPVAGKRRVFVLCRNSVSHAIDESPSENALIAYADFNGDDIENGVTLTWSYTSIPTLNSWNVDQTALRRPNNALVCDGAGNLYYLGYHSASDANDNYIDEPEIDVFKCTAYGSGAWTRQIFTGSIPTWNPPESHGSTIGYFQDDSGVPYTNLKWVLMNSSHVNASIDDLGRIHFPGLWGLSTTTGSYFNTLQFVKELVFDTATNNLSIKEIYPQKDSNDTFNTVFSPWDKVAPWGVVDSYVDDGNGGTYPAMVTDWNFPYWNPDSHDNAMSFHCGNMKVTENNGHGMQAMVWQNSYRAKLYNDNADTNYAAYANTPEIYISVTSDNGLTWSEPIIINNQETPQFTGIKPMWVYPADKIKYVGMQGNQKVGKLGLMFYDDNTWGSNAIAATEFPNDGGRVMFTELQIVFPAVNAVTDPFGIPTVLSSSMVVMSGVTIDGVSASDGDVVAAYVSVGGVPQLRGKGTIVTNSGVTGCLLQLYTESNGETISFKVWDASTNEVINVGETLSSQVNGTVGSWPNNLFWLHANHGSQQSISLQAGWNMVSLNMHRDNMQISTIFANIMQYIQCVKSTDGVFFPNNPFSTLNSLSDGKGYYVRVSQSCLLQIAGTQVDASVAIPLQTGWNLCGFTPQSSLAVGVALASIADNLQEVKGVEGVYIPGNPLNTLSTLSPGRAYWIKLSSAASLVYPASGKSDVQSVAPSCEVWGSPIVKSNSQVILVKVDTNAIAGDLLAAFVDNELRGLAELKQVDGKQAALLQVFTDETGEDIQFKLYRTDGNVIYNLSPGMDSTPGETIGNYQTGDFLSLKFDQPAAPAIDTKLLYAYPNPFKSGTSIALNVAKDAPALKVEVYNLRGQKVSTLFNGQMLPGASTLWWNGLDDSGNRVASGVYFCRMSSGNSSHSIKLMNLK